VDVAQTLAVGAAAGLVTGAAAVALVTAARRRARVGGYGVGEVPVVHGVSDPPAGVDVVVPEPPATTSGPPAGAVVAPRPPATTEDSTDVLARRSLDALRVGVLVLDPADAVVFANPAARHMGLLRPDGEPAHTILATLAGQVRRGGSRRDVELDLPRARGDGRDPLGVRVRVVAIGGGHVAVEVEDVTEAHRVARVRRDFVANVSHELKTPVGALQLLAEALIDATDDPEAARRFAERIQHESSRMGRLVGELIELSRLQGAEPLPDPEPVAVDRIVNEVLDRTRTVASAKDITVVWSGARGLTVYGHERQLVTAVGNLVDNAVAYSGEDTTVTVTTTRTGDTVGIAVTDEGIGIAADDTDRIFERFYRADPARSRATGGTGLGLAIVKHIATNHGGQVAVTSVVGEGSTFTLRLPARPPGSTGSASGPVVLAAST